MFKLKIWDFIWFVLFNLFGWWGVKCKSKVWSIFVYMINEHLGFQKLIEKYLFIYPFIAHFIDAFYDIPINVWGYTLGNIHKGRLVFLSFFDTPYTLVHELRGTKSYKIEVTLSSDTPYSLVTDILYGCSLFSYQFER